jgi:hypothetical protein
MRKIVTVTFMISVFGISSADLIDTLSTWPNQTLDSLGELSGQNPGGVTFGQTFTIPGTNALLNTLSFIVDDYIPSPAQEVCTFEVFIMAWSNSRPAGPVLFQSDPLVTNGLPGMQRFDVDLKGTFLTADQAYVVFFTANNFLNGIRSDAAMGSGGNLYPGGTFVEHYSGFGFHDLLIQDWHASFGGTVDLAIRLDYSQVPEPCSIALLALGALLARKRRK